MIASRDEFDRVSNDFAADQGSAHPLSAHGDAIGDRDGIEFHRCSASRANAGLHRGSEFTQMEVAGADFSPGIGNADDGAAQILIAESDSL